MTIKSDYETQDSYGAFTETKRPETARVIPFPTRSTTETSTPSQYINSTDLSKSASHLRYQKKSASESFWSEINKTSKKHLEEALDKITDACDKTISASERSNCFDDWCDLLRILVRSEEHFSRHHRRIFGTLLSTVNKLDISDFNDSVLKIFRDTTNTLRQPRLTKIESKRAIADILKTKTRISLSLNMQDITEQDTERLQLILKHLVDQSQ
jgi:hypothetical protein